MYKRCNTKRMKSYSFLIVYVLLMYACGSLEEGSSPTLSALMSTSKTGIYFRNIVPETLIENVFAYINYYNNGGMVNRDINGNLGNEVNLIEKYTEVVDSLKNTVKDVMPSHEVGTLLDSEDFSNNLDSWLTERKVITKVNRGWLYMESFDAEIENPKGNIWWKNDFENPYVIEFDYQPLSDEGLTMMFWNAFGQDGKDVFSLERDGNYVEYVNSNLTAYHCTFHRFKTRLSNLRKAPGFHLAASAKDPIGTEDRNVHKL